MKNFLKYVTRTKPEKVWVDQDIMATDTNIVWRGHGLKVTGEQVGWYDFKLLKKALNFNIDKLDLDYSYEFPITGELIGELHNIHIAQDLFAAIDTNNPKFELDGVFIDHEFGKMAATDTRRLCVKKCKMEKLDYARDVIIPKTALYNDLIIGTLYVYRNDWASFEDAGYTVYTEIIPGKYPDYQRIVPQVFKFEIRFNVDIKALKKFGDCTIEFKANEIIITDYETRNILKSSCDFPYTKSIKLMIEAKYLHGACFGENIIKINDNNLPVQVNDTTIMPIVGNFPSIRHDDFKVEDLPRTFKYEDVKKVERSQRVTVSQLQKRIKELEGKVVALGGTL